MDPIAVWTRRLTYATATIGVITAFLGFLQWLEIKKNSKDTRDAVEAAKMQADATNDVARSMRQQVDEIELQQRSYVGAVEAALDYFEAGKEIKSYLLVSNYGLPTEIYHYSISKIYPSEDVKQLLSDDARDHYVSDCQKATLDSDSMAKNHTTFFGIMFPTQIRSIVSELDNVVADDKILSGQNTFVRLDCLIYKVKNEIKHTLTCFNVKSPLPPPRPPSPQTGLPPKPTMRVCETANFAQ